MENETGVQACPRCGSKDIFSSYNDDSVCHAKVHRSHVVGYWIECNFCDYFGETKFTVNEAKRQWNLITKISWTGRRPRIP